MSMRVDRHSKFPGVTLQPRTPNTWIPDERVQRCFKCNLQFSMLRRKHHCRSCGRIFCASCTAYREKMPSYYRSYAPSPSQIDEPQRMCANCANKLRKAFNVDWIVKCLAVMPVTFPEIFLLRLLDKKWNHGVNTILSLYRGLQYKLPCQKYIHLEITFLKTHYIEFQHHLPWQIHTMCALESIHLLDFFLKKFKNISIKTLSCRWLLCSRTCRASMSVDDILRLGLSGCLRHNNILHWTVETLKKMNPVIHHKMMFWWVYIGIKCPNLFRIGLIPLCHNDITLFYTLWFDCELQKNNGNIKLLTKVQEILKKTSSSQIKEELLASIAFIHLMKTLVLTYKKILHKEHITNFFNTYGCVCLPWNPAINIVHISNTKRFSSATKPLSITCHTKQNISLDILIKNEDVRTDRLAMVIGYWIMSLSNNILIHLYDVFPFGKDMGCVVMIPNSTTLFDVRKTSTLLNFILSNNPSQTVLTMRSRMVASCTGACLLAFTMGLGDRHLENIMVTKEGFLAHVDFGYVFGDDPKHISTPMRITEDMVDAIGGKASPTFVSFIQRTQKGYETMRLYSSFWYNLLSAESFIFKHEKRPWKRIRDHILDRFVPGEWDEEASLHIQTIVQRAAEDSILQRFSDLAHSASIKLEDIFHIEL
jgi:hypothetical protein